MAGTGGCVVRVLDEARERRRMDPGAPEVVRVRLSVDMHGELGEELERLAAARGVTKEALVREGLGYIHEALQARRDGSFIGRP